ncbi:hypothetical protein IG631_23858 [Alternaria alternata]|nr:hypothetical protein IG631_23858 [Alternaria alternata]
MIGKTREDVHVAIAGTAGGVIAYHDILHSIETVHFNKFLELVEQHPHRVILKFADGTTAEASLLAGSDGIESVVRVDILGPSSDRRWHQCTQVYMPTAPYFQCRKSTRSWGRCLTL